MKVILPKICYNSGNLIHARYTYVEIDNKYLLGNENLRPNQAVQAQTTIIN